MQNYMSLILCNVTLVHQTINFCSRAMSEAAVVSWSQIVKDNVVHSFLSEKVIETMYTSNVEFSAQII